MKLLSIFGRNAAARDRPRNVKNLRRSSRTNRLNFRRQLRGLTCFSTEEKSPQREREDKQKRKRGLLSQRLRFTESSENQAASSLGVMSQLVLRPSTCPPQSEANIPVVTELQVCGDVHTNRRTPLPLPEQDTSTKCTSADNATTPHSSLDNQEPSSITVESLDEEQLSAYLKLAFQRCAEERGEVELCSERVTPSNELSHIKESTNNDLISIYDNTAAQKVKRQQALAFREKCFEVIRRHETMLDPVAESAEQSDKSIQQPPSKSCLVSGSSNYLNIPEEPTPDTISKLDDWKPYFTMGPEGIWKMVIPNHSDINIEGEDDEPQSLGLVSALIHTRSDEVNQTDGSIGQIPLASATVFTKIFDGPELSPQLQTISVARPVHDSQVHCLVARDWLPASCWWGRSLLLEEMLHTLPHTTSFTSYNTEAVQSRPAALLQVLNPLSSQLKHVGLQRLVSDLSEGTAKQDERQVAWLTQPDLPRLFVLAGFGPDEMTRWLLEVPQEMEDDGVMVPEMPMYIPQADNTNVSSKNRNSEPDSEKIEPSLHRVEEIVNIASPQVQDIAAVSISDSLLEVTLQETDTSTIETPFTRFGDRWTSPTFSQVTKNEPRCSVSLQSVVNSRLNVHAKEFRPLCSDPCTFVSSEHTSDQRSLAKKIASESDAAYKTNEMKQWWVLDNTGGDPSGGPKLVDAYKCSPDAPPSLPACQTANAPDPISEYDSETEIGEHLPQILKDRKPLASNSGLHIRNASVRPIDSEVDIVHILHEQNGYMNFGESAQTPMTTAYLTLPLNEVDSETEMGLALPLTDQPQVLDERSHRCVRLYDSETEMGELVSSINRVDSETEMGRRLEKMPTWPQKPEPDPALYSSFFELKECDSELGMGGSSYPTPFPDRQEVVGSSSMSRLPATPVQVDSETEMGVVLNMFEQGLLPSRYFAGVQLSDDAGAEITRLASSDSDINIAIPGDHEDDEVQVISRNYRPIRSYSDGDQAYCLTKEIKEKSCEQTLDKMYATSKSLSKAIIKKALKMLEDTAARYPISRTESTAFGPSSELEGIEVESNVVPSCSFVPREDGACSPDRIIPQVNVTTSDGSFVVLFPSHPVEHAEYYETEERLLLKMSHPVTESEQTETFLDAQSTISAEDQPADTWAVTESRGFKPTGDSLSEQELERRLIAGRCAEAAMLRKHRSPSPRQRASDDGSLRVLYRADNAGSWSTVSPEGLSGLALAPVDPELADVKWKKNSRGEDGELEQPCFGGEGEGEAAPAPPSESQSQTELSKNKPPTTMPMGANSWC